SEEPTRVPPSAASSRRGDPPRALAPRPPSPHGRGEAPPLRRPRPRSALPLASLSDVAHTERRAPRFLAALRGSGGALARVSNESLRRRRGLKAMAKTYKQIMDEARKVVPEVSPEQVKASVDGGKHPVVLDVRE